ncbi:unnamed protein product [Heterobilharzia americana]|nr:unnamed protein product [Heterobilharzia americana]
MRATPILLITLGIVVNRIDSHKSTEYNELWSVWKSQYDKQYENEKEEEIRRSKWIENIEKIHSHNLRYDLGLETFTLGINQFTDIDWKEFHSQYAMNKQLEIPESSYIEEDYDVNNVGWTPESYDWRHLNIVNEPRDQDQDCMANSSDVVVQSIGFKFHRHGYETILKWALYNEGPYVISMNIDENFLSYKSGIYQSETCTHYNLNQSMLLVGYGYDNDGVDYWILQNSWGKQWGEQGYVKVRRNNWNMCGIASMAFRPILRSF